MPPLWKIFGALNNIPTNLWQSKQLALLIPFATTYRSKAAFSALVTIKKTKQRNRSGVQHDMRVALSKTQPQFSVLVQKTTTGFSLNDTSAPVFV